MSVVSIRQALETAVNGITPAIQTSWENVVFEPTIGTPYQAVYILFANPENNEYGSVHRELGFIQIDLYYPSDKTTLASDLRAELIRSTFKRGNSFVDGGVTVTIHKTPSVDNVGNEGAWYRKMVRVPFYANIFD